MPQLLPDPSVWILLVLDGVLLKIKSVLPNVLLLYPTAYIAYPPASLHRVVKVLPVIDASPLFTSVSLYSSITYSTKTTGGRDCDGSIDGITTSNLTGLLTSGAGLGGKGLNSKDRTKDKRQSQKQEYENFFLFRQLSIMVLL